MKKIVLTCIAQVILLVPAIEAAPERTLVPGAGFPPNVTDLRDLAAEIEALTVSANFHSGESGGMNLKPQVVMDDYQNCVASGRYIGVLYTKPKDLRITGNRGVQRDLSVYEILVGFTDDCMPSALYVTSGDEVLALSKYRGDLAVQIQQRLATEVAGVIPQEGDEPQPRTSPDRDESRLSISPADYKVVSVAGVFGIYGITSVGDLLHFDPNSILDERPRTLEFEPAGELSGPSYLNIPEFRLERVLNHKGHNLGYSFFCRQGIQPGGSLLRFDLRTDWDKMFVVYESDGIVHGVMILEKVPRKAK